MLVLSLCLVAASVYTSRVRKAEPLMTVQPLAEFPFQLGAWKGLKLPDLDPQVLSTLGVDDYLNRLYSPGNVALYVGFYGSQSQGDTMHSPLNCLPGAGWNPESKGRLVIPLKYENHERAMEINRIVVQKGMERNLVLYWYQSHGRVEASEYWGKIFTVLDAIRLNRTDAALVRVVTPVDGLKRENVAASERRAVGFIMAAFPLLSRFLPE